MVYMDTIMRICSGGQVPGGGRVYVFLSFPFLLPPSLSLPPLALRLHRHGVEDIHMRDTSHDARWYDYLIALAWLAIFIFGLLDHYGVI